MKNGDKMKRLATLFYITIITATASTVLAEANGNSQGTSNGQPFQELNAIINDNRALIDANKDGLTTLQADIANITSDITDLQSDLSDLDIRVSANEGDITNLQTEVESSEGDISSLKADLDQLRADHGADLVDINTAISAAVVRIALLETELQALTNALNLQIADIEDSINDNAVAIDAMLLELATTTAKVLANMMAISDLQDQADALLVRATQHETDINNLQIQINNIEADILALDGTVGYLESLHSGSQGFDPQCDEPYTTLTDAQRHVTTWGGFSPACDNGLVTAWYRFSGAAGTHIPT